MAAPDGTPDGDAAGDVGIGDPPGQLGGVAQRAEHPPGDEPGDRRAEQQCDAAHLCLQLSGPGDPGLAGAGKHQRDEDAGDPGTGNGCGDREVLGRAGGELRAAADRGGTGGGRQ